VSKPVPGANCVVIVDGQQKMMRIVTDVDPGFVA
jgi:hypothetical protein